MVSNEYYNISIIQIKLFITIVECRSFSRAAEIMHFEQSTLSRKISILEKMLGFNLFNRTTRPIELTEKGEILYKEWKLLLSAIERSIEKASYIEMENNTRLSICMADSINTMDDVPTLSMQMHQLHPEVALFFHFVSLADWRQALLSHKTDIAVTALFDTKDLQPEFVVNNIMTIPKLACVTKSSPLAGKEKISFDDLKHCKFITMSESFSPYHINYLYDLCKSHGFEPILGTKTSNALGLFSALQHDDEVLVCDRLLRGYDNKNFKIFELPDTYSALCAVHLEDNKNLFIYPFIELMKSLYTNNQ